MSVLSHTSVFSLCHAGVGRPKLNWEQPQPKWMKWPNCCRISRSRCRDGWEIRSTCVKTRLCRRRATVRLMSHNRSSGSEIAVRSVFYSAGCQVLCNFGCWSLLVLICIFNSSQLGLKMNDIKCVCFFRRKMWLKLRAEKTQQTDDSSSFRQLWANWKPGEHCHLFPLLAVLSVAALWNLGLAFKKWTTWALMITPHCFQTSTKGAVAQL